MKGGYWNGDRCEAYLSISFKLTPLKDSGLFLSHKKGGFKRREPEIPGVYSFKQ